MPGQPAQLKLDPRQPCKQECYCQIGTKLLFVLMLVLDVLDDLQQHEEFVFHVSQTHMLYMLLCCDL